MGTRDAKQTRDALRDQTHTLAGLRPLRFTHWQIRYEQDYVQSCLERAALLATKG